MHTKCQSEKFKGRDHVEDVDVDRRIILKWILKRSLVRIWNRLIWFRIWFS